MRSRYSAVIVDEAQDLSLTMIRLLHSLVGDEPDGLTRKTRHAYWRAEMARAEAALAVERAQARVEHQQAVASYRRQVNEWTQLLQAPENVERAARRGAAFVLLAQAMLGGTISALAFGATSLLV